MNIDGRTTKTGLNNARWVGDEIGYVGMHDRVRAIHGPASIHPCATCGSPAAHWAYDHGDPNERTVELDGRLIAYGISVDHYRPLCLVCHRADNWAAKVASLVEKPCEACAEVFMPSSNRRKMCPLCSTPAARAKRSYHKTQGHRATAPGARTHCPRGHEYSEENTYVKPRGDRTCRTCHRDRERGRRTIIG